jgi:hypothetical protein
MYVHYREYIEHAEFPGQGKSESERGTVYYTMYHTIETVMKELVGFRDSPLLLPNPTNTRVSGSAEVRFGNLLVIKSSQFPLSSGSRSVQWAQFTFLLSKV